jgi:hypothetical protein
MIDELFNEINRRNLVDWGVVLLGVTGVPGVAGHLRSSAVAHFANSELEKMAIDDLSLDLIVELTMDSNCTSNELRESLENVCKTKNIDLERSKRKWRLVSLENILSNLEIDPVYGLIKISEFWMAWEWPSDRPISMRNHGEISPEDYHSQANYEYVIENHREWLGPEFLASKSEINGVRLD